MIFGKTLSVMSFIVLTLSNICIASNPENYRKYSTSINGGSKITLISKNGHENDILFPKEDNNNCENKIKSVCIECNKNGSYKVIYNGGKKNNSNINSLHTYLNQYISVSSVQETTEKEMHFPSVKVIPVFTDCKKIVFNDICSKSNDFDFVITNNREEKLGIVFNLSNDSEFGNIRLNNIDSLNINTVSPNAIFNRKKISSNQDSILRIFGNTGNKSVYRIDGSSDNQ